METNVLQAVYVADKATAIAADPSTWRPAGQTQYFVRIKHVVRPQGATSKFALVSGSDGVAGQAGVVGAVSRADANKVVARVRARLGGRVSGITVVDTFAGLPEKVREDAAAQGVTHVFGGYRDGMVYVVRDTHQTLEDFEKTVFHELHGHVGQACSPAGRAGTILAGAS